MVINFTYHVKNIFLLSALITLMLSSTIFSQKISGVFDVQENSDSLYVGRVQIRLDEGSAAIGNAVIRYKFNPNRLSFAETPKEGENFNIYNFQNGNYISSISHPADDVISINIAKLFGDDIVVTNELIDVAEVIFSVKNISLSPEFETDVIQFFSPASSEMWDLGTWVVTEGESTFQFVSLDSPENGSENISNHVTLQWNSIETAEYYHLQLSKNDDFSELLFENSELTETNVTLDLEKNTKYFWRVSYSNSNGTSSFSSNYSFTTIQEIPQVVLRTPVNDSTVIGSSVWFKWESVNGRDYYQLQVAKDSKFDQIVTFLDTLHINEIEVNNLPTGQKYFWRARASINETFGEYSEINSFYSAFADTNRPNLIAPLNNAQDINTTVVFNWEQIDRADYYQLEVAEDFNFDDIFYINENVESNSQTVYYLEKGKRYFWRVRYSNSSGNSLYSEVSSFETLVGNATIPTLLTPLHNAVDLDTEILFSWKNEGFADNYQINFYTDSGLQNLFYSNDSVKAHEIKLDIFEQGHQYFWRVRSSNKNGFRAYSDLFKFRTRVGNPSILTLIEPINNAVGLESDITFRWNPIDSATSYKIEIAKDSYFNQIVQSKDNILNTEVNFSALEEGVQYYWRVKSHNLLGSTITSNIFNFSTGMGLPSLPVTIYPANNQPNIDNDVSFNWSEVEGAEFYHLEIARDNIFKNIIFSDESLSENEITIQEIGEGKEYFWRVKAISKNGNSSFSDANRFTVKVNKPSDLMSKIIDEEYVRLSWKDNSQVEKRIIIERKLKEDYKFTNFEIIDTVSSDLTHYYDRNTEDGKKYVYRVFSENNVSTSDYSNDVELLFSIKKYDPNIPEEFALSQNYPNPFNPSTKINYSVRVMSDVSLKVYNIIGEEVVNLVNEIQDPGNYTLEWDASNFASGVYLYVMTANSMQSKETFKAVNKMILVK